MTDKETARDKMTECYDCKHKRDVPGNRHIRCANPDPNMQGHQYGIHHGWFCYPRLFDPVWKEVECANFEEDILILTESTLSSADQNILIEELKEAKKEFVQKRAKESLEEEELLWGSKKKALKTNKVVIPDVVFDQITEAMDEADAHNEMIHEHEAEQLELEVGKESK